MSRKITKESIAAFLAGTPFNKANMTVDVDVRADIPIAEHCMLLKLHGNTIARRFFQSRKLEITDAGWPTRTTRERLNGLPGVCVFQKNHTQYLAPFRDGKPVFEQAGEWGGEWISVYLC